MVNTLSLLIKNGNQKERADFYITAVSEHPHHSSGTLFSENSKAEAMES